MGSGDPSFILALSAAGVGMLFFHGCLVLAVAIQGEGTGRGGPGPL